MHPRSAREGVKMPMQSTTPCHARWSARLQVWAAALTLGLLVCSQPPAFGQTSAADDRSRAFRLYEQNKLTEALPILEKLVAASPDDIVLLERLAHCLVAYSITLSEPAQKKEALARARKLAMHAKELGDTSNMVQLLLNQIPPDGGLSEAPFSNRKDAESALTEGDRALAMCDFQNAIEGYQRALKLDPNLYQAPLFLGDAYYKMGQPDEAGKWYAYAIRMNPDRETAYRYWADVLTKAGRTAEARSKLIDAIIAEPYNRAPWTGLGQWAERAGVKIAPPRIAVPDVKRSEDGKSTTTFDPASESSGAWIICAGIRANWANGKSFNEAYPNEKDYRHSLREEAEALLATANFAAKAVKEGSIKKLEPGLEILVKLAGSGLIESYVLLGHADRGISQDYVAYRSTHREKLREYLSQYVVPEVK
jgi:tetratricopeptide (TPR) repeat protein